MTGRRPQNIAEGSEVRRWTSEKMGKRGDGLCQSTNIDIGHGRGGWLWLRVCKQERLMITVGSTLTLLFLIHPVIVLPTAVPGQRHSWLDCSRLAVRTCVMMGPWKEPERRQRAFTRGLTRSDLKSAQVDEPANLPTGAASKKAGKIRCRMHGARPSNQQTHLPPLLYSDATRTPYLE